jgi:hypothetical protein
LDCLLVPWSGVLWSSGQNSLQIFFGPVKFGGGQRGFYLDVFKERVEIEIKSFLDFF